jgi:hypothetical protein
MKQHGIYGFYGKSPPKTAKANALNSTKHRKKSSLDK